MPTSKRCQAQRRAIIDSLAAGASFVAAAEAAGVNDRTVRKWRARLPGFERQVAEVLAARIQTVEDVLFAKARAGHVVACIFWLCNRAKDRWQHVQNVKIEGQMDAPLIMEIKRYLPPAPTVPTESLPAEITAKLPPPTSPVEDQTNEGTD